MKSEQEVFDAVVFHLSGQAVKAEGEDGECLYRAPDGLMCAIGCLIPDSEYSEDMEGKGLTMASLCRALKKNGVLAVSDYVLEGTDPYGDEAMSHNALTKVGHLLQNLQWIHDNEDPSDWRPCFRVLGRALDLDVEGL